MSTFRDFEPDDQDLPEGWDPAVDRDPQWNAIVELAKKADQPEMPLPAVFQAMRMDVRRTLLREGLLKESASESAPIREDMSFGAWVRMMLLGGRSGGQAVRLGFVGAVAFVAGLQLKQQNAPNTAVAIQPSDNPTVVAQAEPPSATVRTVANDPRAQRIDKTYFAEEDWNTAVPGSNGWINNQRMPMQTVGTGVTSSRGQQVDLAGEALDQLQVLKFYSLVDRDERTLAEIRRLEQTVSQFMQDNDRGGNPRVEALENYRRGEQALAAQRYHDAQTAFERAAALMPASSLAFLSQFQIGRISYERTQDYPLALEMFRKCVEDYPAHFMTDVHKDYLLARIEILNQTAADDWQSIMNWQEAERTAHASDAVPYLVQVVQRGSSGKLAGDAALRLKDILIADAVRRDIDHQEVIDILRGRIERSPFTADTARVQFALAEIVARRSQNLGQAMTEYSTVLDMHPDEQTLRLTRSRLNLLMNQRLTGIRAID